MANQIHWFPGHMNKSLHMVEDMIKLVDVVIELLDARAPLSSLNEQLEEISKNKKKIIVLSKPDLADLEQTKKWKEYFLKKYEHVLVLDLTRNDATNIIAKEVNLLGQDKWEKEKRRGMKPQPIRAMIIGIPNVGKSSLINRLAKRKAAGVQNKPGYTRGEQWINVNQNFMLLDTPGILPMNYENQNKAANLALVGSMKEDILPNSDLVNILLSFLKKHYPNALKERFDIDEITDREQVLEALCLKRCLLKGNNEKDYARGEQLLLKEFKDGLLGKITLEWL